MGRKFEQKRKAKWVKKKVNLVKAQPWLAQNGPFLSSVKRMGLETDQPCRSPFFGTEAFYLGLYWRLLLRAMTESQTVMGVLRVTGQLLEYCVKFAASKPK